MILPWTPNQSCSGSVTLNIDALGDKRIFEDDGITAATCASGRTYLLEYQMSLDGGMGAWRKVFSSGGNVQSVNGQIGAVTITTATLGLENVSNFGVATQAEAEAGTVADKYMTPERTKQAVTAVVGNVSNFGVATQAEAEAGTAADKYMTPKRTKQAITYNAQSRAVGITIDGGGSTITTGTKGYVVVPFSCTIQSWSVVADQPGSIMIDVWKHNSVPTALNTITGGAKPFLSSAQLAVAQPVTGWSTAVNAHDVVAFHVDSASTVTRATLTIACRR